MTKFNLGDRVKLVDEDDYRAPYAGTVAKVLDPDPGGAEPRYVVREVRDSERNHERFVESALTLDTDPETLDIDDLKAVVAELIATANSTEYGLQSSSRADRIRTLARIGFHASRAIWLETSAMSREESEAKYPGLYGPAAQ